MYLSPFASKLIWSFVSFLSERFFYVFFASKVVFKFFCLVFLPSFRLFVELTLGGVFVFSLSELIFVGFFDFPLIEFALDGFLVDPFRIGTQKRDMYTVPHVYSECHLVLTSCRRTLKFSW